MSRQTINSEILRLAVPNVVSNLTVPLLGLADVAVAGRIGSDVAIGALSVGTMVFNLVYWNCGFLRMSTSGLTAQSFGAQNWAECRRLLTRAVVLALALATILLAVRNPLTYLSLRIIDGDAGVLNMAHRYLTIRWFSVPADILLFAFNGWFIGMQDSRTPMVIAIIGNVVNVGLNIFLSLHLGWGIDGIATATLIAQYLSLLMAISVYMLRYSPRLERVRFFSCFDRVSMRRFFCVNGNIFQRSLCVVAAYFIQTTVSARFGAATLAANALLMQLFTLFSYLQDGLAYAAEALCGRYLGARNFAHLRAVVRHLALMCLTVMIIYGLVYVVAWRPVLMFFEPTEAVLEVASHYIGWAIAVPLVSTLAFLLDGVLIGATQVSILRNCTFVALVSYVCMLAITIPTVGNTGIWISFLVFMLMRGVLLLKPTLRLIKGFSLENSSPN
ncbi:MAG: MATE family efflux transporter [Bacteroidales bacterium]|nr:MATE family efflux transporter [Bacteroidales bacterium]